MLAARNAVRAWCQERVVLSRAAFINRQLQARKGFLIQAIRVTYCCDLTRTRFNVMPLGWHVYPECLHTDVVASLNVTSEIKRVCVEFLAEDIHATAEAPLVEVRTGGPTNGMPMAPKMHRAAAG